MTLATQNNGNDVISSKREEYIKNWGIFNPELQAEQCLKCHGKGCSRCGGSGKLILGPGVSQHNF